GSVPNTGIEVIGPGKDVLYGAWHSTNHLVKVDRSNGANTQLALEGFDDWVRGISEASGGRVAIASPARKPEDSGILVFDAVSGKRLGVVPKTLAEPADFFGLSCFNDGDGSP